MSHPSLTQFDGLTQFTLATDSEWQDEPLTTQVHLSSGGLQASLVFFHPQSYQHQSRAVLTEICEGMGAIPVHDFLTPWMWLMENLPSPPSTVNVLMFYSPKDLCLLLGEKSFDAMVEAGFIIQKRRITAGRKTRKRYTAGVKLQSDGMPATSKGGKGVVKMTIDDLRGNAPGSLKSLADAVSIQLDKDIIDPTTGRPVSKAKMGLALELNPVEFLRYAVNDARVLPELRTAFNTQVMELLKDVMGMDLDEKDIKGTNGALVAATLEKWVLSLHPGLPLLNRKLGIISRVLTSEEARSVGERMGRAVQTALLKYRQGYNFDPIDPAKVPALNQFEAVLTQSASSSVLGMARDTSAFGGLVLGGRAVNEDPTRFQVSTLVADIDLQSCYGSALRGFDYPLGIPTVIGFTQNTLADRPSLKTFFAKYGKSLVPGLWEIKVSGTLPFEQDLLFSKVSTVAAINKAVGVLDEGVDLSDLNEVSQLGGDFGLYRNTLSNASLTSGDWELIQKVCTSKELVGFQGLKVESAVFYDAKNRAESLDAFVVGGLEHKGRLSKEGDNRWNKWVSVPLEGFIGALVEHRNVLKKKAKTAVGEEKTRLSGRQTLLKLFVNTTYGCLASPFFRVSNAVVANNITSSARRHAWMMAKALGTLQSVTDGGAYPVNTVRFLGSRKPGFGSLSRYNRWKEGSRGTTGHLLSTLKVDESDWEGLSGAIAGIIVGDLSKLQEGPSGVSPANYWAWVLDRAAIGHIRAFWSAWGVEFEMAIEHKGENLATSFAWVNKTDYAGMRVYPLGDTPNPYEFRENGVDYRVDLNQIYFKVRGEKPDFTDPTTVAPKLHLLLALVSGHNLLPEDRVYFQNAIATLNDVRTRSQLVSDGVKAGDGYRKRMGENGLRIKTTHLPCPDHATYRKWERQNLGRAAGKSHDGTFSQVHRRVLGVLR